MVMLDMLQVALTALGSAVVLFFMTKLMGNKQISQLTMFDYVIGITIGSIAAEMSTQLERPLHSVVALTVYGSLAAGISWAAQRSLKVRQFMDGRAWVLLHNGRLYRRHFKKAHIDVSEFLTLCRVNGYFDLNQIQTAVMETNGKISFLPVSAHRPATPADLGQSPEQESFPLALILDGRILSQNLHKAGKEEVWLRRQLREQGEYSPDKVFLAIYDEQNGLSVYPAEE